MTEPGITKAADDKITREREVRQQLNGPPTAARPVTMADQASDLLKLLASAEIAIGRLKQAADDTTEILLRRVQAIKREIGG